MRLLTAGYPYEDPFGIFDQVKGIKRASEITKDDCLLLWGGADIGTELYDQKPNRYCFTKKASERDVFEMEMLNTAVRLDIPIIGICRGAQLMTIFTGGYLIQHVVGHSGIHDMYCHDTGETIKTNSAHHQVCQPIEPSVILATAGETEGLDEDNIKLILDEVPEVIYFPQIRGIGIQYHPEWDNCSHEAHKYAKQCILDYIINEKHMKEAA